MMVIVPRIAAVSYLNTIPFIYGIEHEGNLRAELLLSPPAVWIARKGVDPDLTEGLQHALTFGIEHTYEAVLEYGFDRKPYDAYGYLTQNIDYIFDNQKHKALQKFWNSGIKVSPRANPG